MKRFILFCALFQFAQFSVANDDSPLTLQTVRQLYVMGAESESSAKELLELLSGEKAKSALLLAYRGGAEALIARHAWNPYMKLKYLDISMQTLSQSILMDAKNAEIRFIRFSIQHYVPAFLGYSSNLEEDKKVIVQELLQQNSMYSTEVKRNITAFLIESNRCTATEVDLLNTLF
jgi:hypothetical protein